MYSFNGFCKVVIRYAAINAWRDRNRRRQRENVLETVYLVIDERYKSGKPFIITTNLPLEKFQNPADLEYGRIYDRIMERCVPVAFSGKNYRTGRGRANIYDGAFRTILNDCRKLIIPVINEIFGKTPKKYHIECESSLPDGKITIRLFEYESYAGTA